LLDRERYTDIPQTASEFVKHIQKALIAIDNLSQTDSVRASALNKEISIVLLSYNYLVVQELASVSHGNHRLMAIPATTYKSLIVLTMMMMVVKTVSYLRALHCRCYKCFF